MISFCYGKNPAMVKKKKKADSSVCSPEGTAAL
jgi:hypothetical protein